MRKKRILVGFLGAVFLCFAGGSQATAAGEEAEYVGTSDCLDCHDEMEEAFSRNVHSKTSNWGVGTAGCEACHGPGSLHVESDGEVAVAMPTDLEGREANSVCLDCHDGALAQAYWRGSAHDQLEVACVSCHNIHSNFESLLNSRSEARTCFECHPEQRTFIFKRSHHPLNDSTRKSGAGKMSCSSCHNPHGSQSEMLIAANSINDKCYECHREMQAPVLWEHSPVKENCLNCHDAHGSNYANMLTLQRTRLCQDCHEAGRHQTVAGEEISFLVLNRSCSNCHAQVHGSNHPSGLKLKR
jgi:DmsE family decaheme c-type cytochrome